MRMKYYDKCAVCGEESESTRDVCYNCRQTPTWKCNGGNCEYEEYICDNCYGNMMLEDAYDRFKEHGPE